MLSSIVGSLTSNKSAAINPIGGLYETFDDTYGYRLFKYVHNEEASTASVAGAPAARKLTADKLSCYACYIPLTATLDALGGIWMAAITAQYYGWIQLLGYHTALKVYGAVAAYDTLKCSNTNAYQVADNSQGTQSTYPKHCVTLEAHTVTNTTTTLKGIINVGAW